MKYSLLLIISSFLLLGLSTPSQEINDLQRLGVKGKVKSISETKYLAILQGEQLIKDSVIIQKLIKFNENGYETERTLLQYGEPVLSRVFLFGNQEGPMRMKEFDKSRTLHLVVDFKYDTNGRKSEAIYHYLDQSQYFPDRNNSEVYIEVFDMKLFTNVKYIYNFDGLCTDEEYFYDTGELMYKNFFRYDYKGNRSETVHLKSFERTSWITKYKYDRNNFPTESRLYISNRIAVKSTFTYTFDTAGNWINRDEKREVHRNLLTEHIDEGPYITERAFTYY